MLGVTTKVEAECDCALLASAHASALPDKLDHCDLSPLLFFEGGAKGVTAINVFLNVVLLFFRGGILTAFIEEKQVLFRVRLPVFAAL